MNKEITQPHQTFESLKQTEDGAEFWFARQLQDVLDYSRLEKFEQVINKAMTACKQTGEFIDDHFHQVVKMVRIWLGSIGHEKK